MGARPIEYVLAALLVFVALALTGAGCVWYVGGLC